MNTGLVLGKFAPLHRGHQLVIETAMAEMDHVIVLIYDVPEVTPVPLTVRAKWIQDLYPQVELLEAWDGPLEVSRDPEMTRQHDAYLLRRLAGRAITHFYSSEFYGEHVSQALGAIDRRVDAQRSALSISGTQLRSQLFEHRRFVHPRVYRDLVTHVVFLGAPSTGKTTLAQMLAEQLSTVWVPEFGREYWEQHQQERKLSQEQLLEIATGHRQREEQLLLDAKDVLLIDTEAITTMLFAYDYHGRVLPELERLAEQSRSRYDLFFLCEDDIPYDDTWDRSGAMHRGLFQRRLKSELKRLKIPYRRLLGSMARRTATVKQVLHMHRKW